MDSEKIIGGYEFQINYDESKKPSFRSDRDQFVVVMPNLNYNVPQDVPRNVPRKKVQSVYWFTFMQKQEQCGSRIFAQGYFKADGGK